MIFATATSILKRPHPTSVKQNICGDLCWPTGSQLHLNFGLQTPNINGFGASSEPGGSFNEPGCLWTHVSASIAVYSLANEPKSTRRYSESGSTGNPQRVALANMKSAPCHNETQKTEFQPDLDVSLPIRNRKKKTNSNNTLMAASQYEMRNGLRPATRFAQAKRKFWPPEMVFLWPWVIKTLPLSPSTAIEHQLLTPTVRTSQCGHTVWGILELGSLYNNFKHLIPNCMPGRSDSVICPSPLSRNLAAFQSATGTVCTHCILYWYMFIKFHK